MSVDDRHIPKRLFPEVSMQRTIAAVFTVVLLSSTLPTAALLPWSASPAQAQSAVVLENLQFKGESTSVRIPKMTIEGGNASKAEIEAYFDTRSLNTLAERLAKLSARSISIPLIELSQNLPDSTGVTSYKDIVFRDIRNGVIGEGVSPLTTSSAKAKPGKGALGNLEVTIANTVMRGVDLPLMLRFSYDKAKDGEGLKTIVAEQSVGKTVYTIGNEISVSIASLSLRDLKARPLQKPLFDSLADLQNQAQLPAADRGKASMGFVSDMMTAISFGNIEMTGLSLDGKLPGEKNPLVFTMDKLSGAGGGDLLGRFSMQGLKIGANDVKVNFGEFTLDGLDMSGMWDFLRKFDGGAQPDLSNLDPRAFIPRLSLLRIAGIDIDVPDTKTTGQRIKAKLGLFETKMANFVGPVPANVAIAVDGLKMDIPANSKEKGLQDILALGYKSLDVAMRYDQVWDEASKTLKLNELSLNSVGMGSVSAKTEIGNVPKEAFTLDKAVAAVAALGVSAKSFELLVKNDSMFEKLLEQQAKLQKRKASDLRAELATGATLMAPLFLGDHPAAKLVGDAIGTFIANPKNIKIGAVAKDGVSMADFVAVSDPKAILKKVDITASANE
jgi:hypothetical protein